MPLPTLRFRELAADTPAPRAVILFLHGYGAGADDLVSLAQMAPATCRRLVLEAPLPLGAGARAWFSLGFTAEGLGLEEGEAREAVALVTAFVRGVQDEMPDVPVLLVGFSQGAMVSLLTALMSPGLVQGVVCFSGLLPEPFAGEVPVAANDAPLPLWIGHGTHDDVLPIVAARAMHKLLAAKGYALVYREYAMRHEITGPELRDAYAWLAERIG